MDAWNPIKCLKGQYSVLSVEGLPRGSEAKNIRPSCPSLATPSSASSCGLCVDTFVHGCERRSTCRYASGYSQSSLEAQNLAAVAQKPLFQPGELWPEEGNLIELSRCHTEASRGSECHWQNDFTAAFMLKSFYWMQHSHGLYIWCQLAASYSPVNGISCFWGQLPRERELSRPLAERLELHQCIE